MHRIPLAVLTFTVISAFATPAAARDIMALCSTSNNDGPFVTNIAPITVPDDVTSARDMKVKVEYAAAPTMAAIGLHHYQTVGCSFEDPSLRARDGGWMNGNQPQSDMVAYQRRLIEMEFRLVRVDRLDSGAATPKGGLGNAMPPPGEHEDGQPLKFFWWVGMVPTASDTRNPSCVSQVITLSDKVDWKEFGASGRAEALTAKYRDAFSQACAKQGQLAGSASPLFDRGDGTFRYAPHTTDRRVMLSE